MKPHSDFTSELTLNRALLDLGDSERATPLSSLSSEATQILASQLKLTCSNWCAGWGIPITDRQADGDCQVRQASHLLPEDRMTEGWHDLGQSGHENTHTWFRWIAASPGISLSSAIATALGFNEPGQLAGQGPEKMTETGPLQHTFAEPVLGTPSRIGLVSGTVVAESMAALLNQCHSLLQTGAVSEATDLVVAHSPMSGNGKSLPVQVTASWSGALVASIPLLNGWLHMVMDAMTVNALGRKLCPGTKKTPEQSASPLVALSDAARNKTVHLEVCLKNLSVDLATLMSFKPGDVLATGHRLEQPLLVRLGKNADVLPHGAALGRSGSQRAIELL